MRAVRTHGPSLRGAACVAALLTACGLLLAILFPAQASATFKDGPDSYPATQDLGTYGTRIDADDLPDGTYKVGARTSSRMCILYTNPDDAESRESKEQAIVSVIGGSMVAVFYISKAYTHLYLGTEEEARTQTDEAGEDASAYIAGDPDAGYVPHLFAIPIPALNVPITVATYSGGSKGIEQGVWYTRTVVFTMTESERQAAVSAGEPESNSAAGGGRDDADASAGQSGAGEESEAGESATGGDGHEEDADKETAKEGGQRELTERNVSVGGQGFQVGAEAPAGGVASDEPGDGAADSTDRTATRAAESAGMRGVLMSIAGDEAVIDVSGVGEQGGQEADRPLLSPGQVIALVLAVVFIAGAVARSVAFFRSLDRGKDSG